MSAGVWGTAGRPVVDGEGRLHVWSGKGTYWISQPTTDGFVDLSFSGDALPADGQLMFGSDGTLYAYTPTTPALYVVMPRTALKGTEEFTITAPKNLAVSGQGGRNTNIHASGTVAFLPGTTLSADTKVTTGPN